MVLQRGDNCLDHVTMSAIAAADMDLRFLIHRLALFGEARQRCRTISTPEQGTRVSAARSFGENIDRSVKPDGNRPLVEQVSRSRVDESPATGSNDAHLTLNQPRDQAAFAVAKVGFAVAFEQFGGRRPRSLLDRHVAVDEGKAKPLRQATADGGLPRTHQADENDRPVKNIRQLLHFVAVSLWAGLYIEAQGRAKAFLQPKRYAE